MTSLGMKLIFTKFTTFGAGFFGFGFNIILIKFLANGGKLFGQLILCFLILVNNSP